MSDKSFPPRPPHPPCPPPPLPKNNQKVIRRQCCEKFSSILQRAKHLATCQLSCKLTTSSKCAIFDKLQQKIRSIASRPAQKVTGKSFRAEHQERVTSCMCLRVSDKSFPPPPPPPPLSPPPHPKNNHTVIRRQCCETLQAFCKRAKQSCNVPTISKSGWKKFRAEHPRVSCPPPPSFPPTLLPPHLPPPLPIPPHPKNNHTVIRRQCCETFQSSFNVPSILQRANYLATSQHLLNAPSVTSYKRKIRSIASRPAQKVTGAACACVGQKFPTPSPTPPSPPPPHPKNNHTVIRGQCCETFQTSCNVPTFLQRHNSF